MKRTPQEKWEYEQQFELNPDRRDSHEPSEVCSIYRYTEGNVTIDLNIEGIKEESPDPHIKIERYTIEIMPWEKDEAGLDSRISRYLGGFVYTPVKREIVFDPTWGTDSGDKNRWELFGRAIQRLNSSERVCLNEKNEIPLAGRNITRDLHYLEKMMRGEALMAAGYDSTHKRRIYNPDTGVTLEVFLQRTIESEDGKISRRMMGAIRDNAICAHLNPGQSLSEEELKKKFLDLEKKEDQKKRAYLRESWKRGRLPVEEFDIKFNNKSVTEESIWGTIDRFYEQRGFVKELPVPNQETGVPTGEKSNHNPTYRGHPLVRKFRYPLQNERSLCVYADIAPLKDHEEESWLAIATKNSLRR